MQGGNSCYVKLSEHMSAKFKSLLKEVFAPKSPSLSQSLEIRRDSCKHVLKLLELFECSWLIAAASWMNSCEFPTFKWLAKQISLQTCPNCSQSLQIRWVVLSFAAPYWNLMPIDYLELFHYLNVKSLCPTNPVQLTLRTSNYQNWLPEVNADRMNTTAMWNWASTCDSAKFKCLKKADVAADIP